MMKRLSFIGLFFISLMLVSQTNSSLKTDSINKSARNNRIVDSLNHNDGPYMFIDKDMIIEKNIVKIEEVNESLNLKITVTYSLMSMS